MNYKTSSLHIYNTGTLTYKDATINFHCCDDGGGDGDVGDENLRSNNNPISTINVYDAGTSGAAILRVNKVCYLTSFVAGYASVHFTATSRNRKHANIPVK